MSLLELARSLDLVETIHINSPPPCETQQYKFGIIIDFEATCWDREKNPGKWQESEIIEFPAVLLNFETGQIELEFQQYVMPTESSRLSEFCISLTGITQDKIENGCPLPTAIMLFEKWLKCGIEKYGLILPKTNSDNLLGNTVFITWSDWDLGVCLKKECDRKRINRPSYFDQWIDLKYIFKRWYRYKPLNFSDALQNAEMEFIGREHSGIDDSRNIARLAYKMVKAGAELAITKDLKPLTVRNKY